MCVSSQWNHLFDQLRRLAPYLTKRDLKNAPLFEEHPMEGLTLVVREASGLNRRQEGNCCDCSASVNKAMPPRALVKVELLILLPDWSDWWCRSQSSKEILNKRVKQQSR